MTQFSGMKSGWGENQESLPHRKGRAEGFKAKKLNLGMNNSAKCDEGLDASSAYREIN